MTMYATLDDCKAELKATSTDDDDKLFELLRATSRRVDSTFHSRRPFFAPYIETREWLIDMFHVDSVLRTFYLGVPLLSLTAAVLGDTTMTVDTTIEAWPNLQPPYYKVRLMNQSDNWYRFCNSDDPVMATLTGQWGWHDDFSNAWLKVDDLQADINPSVTSMTVADVDGTDDLGRAPLLSAGNLIRIGTEFMEATATNTTTNAVTVRRGVNGSTAAAHVTNDDVEVWEIHEPIRRAVIRQTSALYPRRGAFPTANITGVGAISFSADLVAEFRNIMQELAYE